MKTYSLRVGCFTTGTFCADTFIVRPRRKSPLNRCWAILRALSPRLRDVRGRGWSFGQASSYGPVNGPGHSVHGQPSPFRAPCMLVRAPHPHALLCASNERPGRFHSVCLRFCCRAGIKTSRHGLTSQFSHRNRRLRMAVRASSCAAVRCTDKVRSESPRVSKQLVEFGL